MPSFSSLWPTILTPQWAQDGADMDRALKTVEIVGLATDDDLKGFVVHCRNVRRYLTLPGVSEQFGSPWSVTAGTPPSGRQ